jgi:hypothetical protein
MKDKSPALSVFTLFAIASGPQSFAAPMAALLLQKNRRRVESARNMNMKHPRLMLGTVVATAATLTVLYQISIILLWQLNFILALYLASSAATLWMVWRILKDPWTTDKTFDDYFYQDREDLRRHGPD